MAQVSSSNPNSLPGIVTDQPEIFESEPALSDDTGVNDLDLNNENSGDAVALIEVPIREAFSYFAERENQIAQFYVQRYGEYKIASNKTEDESEIEKYHRLVSEVNELFHKFQSNGKQAKSELTSEGSLNNSAMSHNLDILSKQLKALEVAADDGSLGGTKSGFSSIKEKLKSLEKKISSRDDEQGEDKPAGSNVSSQMIRMSALERRINVLENILGHDEPKIQNLFKTTKSDNLTEVADILASWLSLYKAETTERVNRELDYLTHRLEKVNEQASKSEDGKLDPAARKKLEHLFGLVMTTDKYRAMVPTIIHRLNVMEELQLKSAQIATTVNHLEQVQSQIAEGLDTNKDELSSLNEMFNKNIELMQEFSADIDSRIRAIKNKEQ